MIKRVQSDFLYAQPSFASGAARVFDLWGQFDAYSESESPAEADAEAIASDWAIIGQDIFDAMQQHDSECAAA